MKISDKPDFVWLGLKFLQEWRDVLAFKIRYADGLAQRSHFNEMQSFEGITGRVT